MPKKQKLGVDEGMEVVSTEIINVDGVEKVQVVYSDESISSFLL